MFFNYYTLFIPIFYCTYSSLTLPGFILMFVTGDVLLASAFISYVGPFTKTFRDKLMVNTFAPFLQDNLKKALGKRLSLVP